ncbi:MAG TPA: hypothetical protein VF695_05835 [Sphingomonas sp.]
MTDNAATAETRATRALRTPGAKFVVALLLAGLLAIPLLTVYLLNYDR